MVLFGKSVSAGRKKKMTDLLGFRVVKEISYLGVKIYSGRMVDSDFQLLINHSLDRLNTWDIRSLSLAGRITLIKSIFSSIPSLIMSHSSVPRAIFVEFDQLCKKFLGHKYQGRQGLHFVA
ncbi:hypothetical protein KFK09_004007 [Dendrobium nobile]|uniref:Uncharacterized protein n=1 Tax=Dendrobium nobile TaxID=94219 RepID=A0A8T3C2T2_DENNO|nr:hypothetical protein KFK09_004007 [Dendrobium nobile]